MAARKGKAVATVITATLIRGRVYYYKNIEFRRGKATVVTDPVLAAELESLVEDVEDTDSEVFEKPFFSVDFYAQPPGQEEEEEVPRVRRRKAITEDDDRPARPKRLKRRRVA